MACDPVCRDEDCDHVLSLHTRRTASSWSRRTLACSAADCGCSEFIDADRHQCQRCGSWDGGLCVCYAR